MSGVRAADGGPDVPDVVATLTDAFAEDPPTRWIFGDDAVARTRFFTGVTAGVRAAGGIVDVEPPAAALLALRPGQHLPDAPSSGRAAEIGRLLAERHPAEPRYHLLFYGVRVQWQGAGLGGRLLLRLTEAADRDRVGVYAEASSWRGARLLFRHGFRPRGRVRLPEGPDLYPVWRDPRS